MQSGYRSRVVRRFAQSAALAAACAVFALTSHAAAADFERLMAALAARQHGHVTFSELQYLAILDHPLESSGELFYDAPDRLEKRTLLPRREVLLLDRGRITIERGRRKHVLDLQQYPQLLPFIESIRATLAGDRAALERLFAVTFEGSLDRWTLRLVPRDPQLSGAVHEIRIEGASAVIRTVEIRQADGDRSVMTIGDDATP